MRTPPSPEDRARAGAWVAAAAGAIGLFALGRTTTSSGAGGPAMLWASAAIYGAVMALVLWSVTRHHPHGRFGPANQVTVARVVLTALTAGAALERPTPALAWWIIAWTVLACGLDGVDGWLARRTRLHSPFGARFDMEIDALLTLALSLLVWRFDKAGVWVLACGLMRYTFVAARWVWPWLGGPLSPTRRGKTVAVLQFVGLGLALSPAIGRGASRVIAASTLAALAWSFAVDVRRLRLAARSEPAPQISR
jgi:phosphatidylglycerophosphate synthase